MAVAPDWHISSGTLIVARRELQAILGSQPAPTSGHGTCFSRNMEVRAPALLLMVLLGGLGACGATGSGNGEPAIAGASTAGSGAGGSDSSGGSSTSTQAGSMSSEHAGSGSGGRGGTSASQGGASGASQGGAGGAGLTCDEPRCIKLCQGGDCACFCEGTGGSAGMAGAGGSSCAALNTARAQSLQAATRCSAELDAQCAKVTTVPNQCGCKTIVNSANPEAVEAAQQAYDAWTLAGCGPYACGALCLEGTAATCYASGAAPGTCGWSM